jgi:NADH:ubiquinone oxidoreductase subunit H
VAAWWWIPLLAIGFVVYFISSVAELNRGPFDLPEAESELVAGYFADYSGIRWAIFMMAEYGGMVAAALFGAALFFGPFSYSCPARLGVALFIVIAVLIRPHRIADGLDQVDVPAHASRPVDVVSRGRYSRPWLSFSCCW